MAVGCAAGVADAVLARPRRLWHTATAAEERRYFERHLVARRSDGDRLGLYDLHFVVPGIQFHASAKGQRGDLIQFIPVECRSRCRQQPPSGLLYRFGDAVAKVRLQQGAQLRGAYLKRLDEESS